MISLRPVGGHGALRRAVAAQGARLLALSPWRLTCRDDATTRHALAQALAATRVVFTSPAAVHGARALLPLAAAQATDATWFGVGAGTAAALRRAGVARVASPERMDSDGLLALEDFDAVRGVAVGLVTAPGGRGRIAAELERRGATVHRADVYERQAVAPSPRAVAALRSLEAPLVLMLTSGEAFERTCDALPADALARLRRARVVAASERLATLARGRGFDAIVLAASARPRALVTAAVAGG